MSTKQKSTFREYTEAILIALVLALFIRTFIVQAFKIPSGSMLPTLQIGDHILVNKFIYGIKVPFSSKIFIHLKDPAKGDIVVFKYPKDPKLDYIKRVVGTEGDRIEIRDKKVFINGELSAEEHAVHKDSRMLDRGAGPRDNLGPFKVPVGKIFVMGDNRDNSYDSRFWGFVDLKSIRGKAFLIYWSWDLKQSLFSVKRFLSIRWNRLGDLLH